MKYRFTTTRMAEIKKVDNPNVDKDLKQLELSYIDTGEGCEKGTTTSEN